MQRLVPVPPDLQAWLMAAVVVDAPATLTQSHFPAMVSSMLVVRLHGQVMCEGASVPPCAWMSASTAPRVYQHCGAVRAVGLVLRPESAVALFVNARGLVNTMRPLPDLVGPRWSEVERSVLAAADDRAQLDVLYQFVRQEIRPPSASEARRQQALALSQAAQFGSDATGQRRGVSPRQLERHFAAHWGMAPKQFEVIARLNNALGHALAKPGGTVADLAMDQGYYDQSHLGRDVRRLAGHPLQTLVQGTQRPLNTHWPLQVGAQAQQPQTIHPTESVPDRKR